MSNADFLATAFVQIRPKTTGFQKELRDQLKTAITPIKPTINVSPTTKGFIASLRTQVRDAIAKSGPHRVPVTPTVGAFRRQLTKELNANPIPITVTTVGKAASGGGVTGAEKAERQLTQSQIAREKIVEELRESETLLKQSLREGIPIKEKDALVTRSQTLARSALTRVTEGQVAAEGALAEARLKARGLKAEEAAGRQAGVVQDLKDEAEAQKEATTQAEILKTTKENLARVNDGLIVTMDRFHASMKATADPTRKLAVAERELGVILKERAAVQKELQGAQRRGETERAEVIKQSLRQIDVFTKTIESEKAQLEVQKEHQRLSTSEKKITEALVKSNQTQISSLTTLREVRAQENALQKQSTALDKLEESAQGKNAVATRAFITAKRQEIQTRREALAAQGDFIRNQQKEITQNKNAARGLIATGLSFLGLRGATLAAGGAFLAGAAAASAFAKSIQSTASLETQLNVFQATAAATAIEMQRVQETARALGADITLPGVGASDAAEAMTALAKAGIAVQDSIDGARGVLQLATAAEIENAEATELVASALNAFGLAGIEAVRVADLLAGSSIEAQGSISDMGIALQQSSAVARQANLNLDDTVSFITLLAQAGIRGSDAGTAIRTALLRLIAPTKDAQKELRKLGVTVFDAQNRFRPQIFAEIDDALSNLNETAKNQVLRKIFGQDAIRFAVIAGRAGTQGLEDVREAITQSGLAAQLAEARTKGFSGQISALRNSTEQLGLALGRSIIPTLEPVIKGLTASVGGLGSAFNKIGPEIVAAVAAFTIFNTRVFGLVGVLDNLLLNLRTMPGGIRGLRASLLSFASGPNAIALGVAALAGGLAYLTTRETEAERVTRKLAEGTEALALSMREAADATSALRTAQKELPTARKAVAQAEKEVADSRRALLNTNAAEGTARRIQLEINLRKALRDQEQALANLAISERDVRLLREDSIAAQERQKQAIGEEIGLINNLITERQKAAALEAESQGELPEAGGPAPVALQLEFITQALQEQVREGQISADRFVRDMARRKEAIIALISILRRVPTEQEIKIILNTDDISAAIARIAGITDRPQEGMSRIGRNIADNLINSAKERLIARANELLDALAGALAQSDVKQSVFAEQLDIITIGGGGPEQQLAVVRDAIAEKQATIDRILAAEAAKRRAGQTTGLDTLRKRRQEARGELASLVEQEKALEEEMKNDAEKAAKDIETKRKERAQAILKIFAASEQKALNRQALAEQTATLKDDISTNNALLDLYEKQKTVARKKIKDAEALAQFLLEVDQKIFEIELEVAADRKDLRKQIREEQREARQRIITGIELDIELAEINENEKREIALRRKLIKALEDQIKHEKGNTNRIKELRNEIARQKQAIKELQNEEKGRADAQARLQFEFLQRQQGFAANLLGNLIPLGNVNGLVGNVQVGGLGTDDDIVTSGPRIGRPGSGIPRPGAGGGAGGINAAMAVGSADGQPPGPTRGQGASQIFLLQRIVRLLEDIKTGDTAPEAKRAKKLGGASATAAAQ